MEAVAPESLLVLPFGLYCQLGQGSREMQSELTGGQASWPRRKSRRSCLVCQGVGRGDFAGQEADSVSTGSDDTKAPPTGRLTARYGAEEDRKSSTRQEPPRGWTADWPRRSARGTLRVVFGVVHGTDGSLPGPPSPTGIRQRRGSTELP
jgi:hypothetical protein